MSEFQYESVNSLFDTLNLVFLFISDHMISVAECLQHINSQGSHPFVINYFKMYFLNRIGSYWDGRLNIWIFVFIGTSVNSEAF